MMLLDFSPGWLSTNGSRECFFVAPSLVNSPSKSCFWNAELLRPLGNTFRFTIECQQSVIRSVSVLLRVCRPTAVSGFVIAVLIWEAIYRMVRRWSRSHVCHEVVKRGLPSLANRNSSSSVIGEILIGLQQASFFHGTPALVFARKRTVPVDGFSSIHPTGAWSALLGCLRENFIGLIFLRCSALALAEPFVVADVEKDSPFLVGVSSQVLSTRRNRNRIVISHDAFLSREGCVWVRAGVVFKRPSVHLSNYR